MPAAKLDEDVVAQILAAVRVGARPEQAAQALGIGKRTYYDWVKRGRSPVPLPGDDLYVKLVREIEKARGSAIVSLIATLRRHANSDWRAAVKLLEMLAHDWARAGGQESGSESEAAPIIHIVVDGKVHESGAARESEPLRSQPTSDSVGRRAGVPADNHTVIDIDARRPQAGAQGAA
jgi:hypothetical protein